VKAQQKKVHFPKLKAYGMEGTEKYKIGFFLLLIALHFKNFIDIRAVHMLFFQVRQAKK